jgi:hypothetical protein
MSKKVRHLKLAMFFITAVATQQVVGGKLPPAPTTMMQASNCAKVRTGSITWNTSRNSSITPANAQQSAIDETLIELIKQLAGVEVNSLTRTNLYLENDNLDDQLQVASFAKAKGRILDYEILDIRKTTEGQLSLFTINLDGRVCADDIVAGPKVAALGKLKNIDAGLLSFVESELSRNFAAYPKIVLADNVASKTYHDIEIEVVVDPPQTSTIDRSAAIAAIKESLGSKAVRSIAQYATRVELRVTMRASVHEDGSKLVSTHLIDRELQKKQQPSPETLAEMEFEAAKKVVKDLAAQLARHIRQAKD